jgi:glycine oxidase
MGTSDVLVIGGGIIGTSIAWRLAERGCSVTLVERGTIGEQASWCAAGMISVQADAAHSNDPAFVQLCRESLTQYPQFIAELEAITEAGVEYHRTGSLFVTGPGEDAAARDRLAGSQGQFGIDAEAVDGEPLHAREPMLHPDIAHGLYLRDDQHVDNRSLMMALGFAARACGVDVREGLFVTGLAVENGAVLGVDTRGGRLQAGTVVLAGGAWSGRIAESSGLEIPTRPVKGQMCTVQLEPGTLGTIIHSNGVYLVPWADGRTYVGATVEEAGFDTRLDFEKIDHLLQKAADLVPAIAEAEVLESWVGLRPGTPDLMPILGRCGCEGLILATGHFRSGILLAPRTAEVITDLVQGESVDLTAFSAGRFNKEAV